MSSLFELWLEVSSEVPSEVALSFLGAFFTSHPHDPYLFLFMPCFTGMTLSLEVWAEASELCESPLLWTFILSFHESSDVPSDVFTESCPNFFGALWGVDFTARTLGSACILRPVSSTSRLRNTVPASSTLRAR